MTYKSPALQVVENLRTFTERTGRQLTPNQRWVLECCERQCGLTSKAGSEDVSALTDEQWRERRDESQRKALEYARKHGVKHV